MQPLTKEDIETAFQDQRVQLTIPDLTPVDWGVLDYFGWLHPAGHEGYVVMRVQGEPRGLVLRRIMNHSAKPRTHMCSWCNHTYRGHGTAMFTTKVLGSDGRRSIGNYICKNLDCSLRMRNLASDPPTYLPETIDLERKIVRLKIAVTGFMGRANLLADLI